MGCFIKTINPLHLRNNKHFQFHAEARALVEKHTPEALKIEAQFADYSARFALEDEGLKKIVKSALTRRIQDADADRDKTFGGLAETVRAACRHFAAATRESAERVRVVLDTYGNVAHLPLNEETSAIFNLLQDLRSAKTAPDVAAVGVGAWVNELERRNGVFDSLVKTRYEETGERSDVVLKAERAKVDEAYRAIVKRINALAEVEGEAAYKPFIDTLNAVIAKYAVKNPHRRPSPSGKGGDEEGEEGGDE